MPGPLMLHRAGTKVPAAIAPAGNSLQALELTAARPLAIDRRYVVFAHERTFLFRFAMSAFPSKAGLDESDRHFRKVPKRRHHDTSNASIEVAGLAKRA